jgi:integrase
MEGPLLVHCADWSSCWRAVGASVEGHRLECKNDNFRKKFLEMPSTRFDEDGPRARQAYAGISRGILVKHLEGSKNIGSDDFVFCRSDDDPRPHDPDGLRREVLYPVLDRCRIKRTPRADGFHAFRRATSKYLRKAGGLELAAVQLGHKRMTTTDEHYNDRDMDD